MEGTAGIGVRPDLGFIRGSPKQLLIRALWAGPKVASSPWFVASSCQHVPSAVSQQTSRVTWVQGRFVLAAKTLNVKLSSQQAWATQSWVSRVPMWHACQSSAPAENAPPPPPLPAWNLLPIVQASQPPAFAACPDPETPAPAWS